jgi:tRNA (guanine10-N2)-dimethyltransferase
VKSASTNRCLFLLSGEHESLPLAELRAVLEAEGRDYEVLERRDQLLLMKVDPGDAAVATQRSALVNWAQEVLLETEADERQILKAIEETDFSKHLRRGSRFGVRVTRLRPELQPISAERLQEEIGSRIRRQMKEKVEVDLNRPETLFLGVLHSDRFFFGIYLASRDRQGFAERRSPRRPFFVPSALHPKTARLMVNLARTRPGDTFLDPFCGTGGLLLEAAGVGCLPIGSDIDLQILSGCRRNLAHYGTTFLGTRADARFPPVRSEAVCAIATDPPYGRASSTKGAEVANLIRESLLPLADVLKRGGYLCFAVPLQSYREDIIATKDFSIAETHTMRIHRSLSRHILVLQRR